MTFPAPVSVNWLQYNGSGVDELGNAAPSWADPVERLVIGWYSASAENIEWHESQVVYDIKMFTPPSFLPQSQDRILLEGNMFEVVGSGVGVGFHGWSPGNVVLLRRVDG